MIIRIYIKNTLPTQRGIRFLAHPNVARWYSTFPQNPMLKTAQSTPKSTEKQSKPPAYIAIYAYTFNQYRYVV